MQVLDQYAALVAPEFAADIERDLARSSAHVVEMERRLAGAVGSREASGIVLGADLLRAQLREAELREELTRIRTPEAFPAMPPPAIVGRAYGPTRGKHPRNFSGGPGMARTRRIGERQYGILEYLSDAQVSIARVLLGREWRARLSDAGIREYAPGRFARFQDVPTRAYALRTPSDTRSSAPRRVRYVSAGTFIASFGEGRVKR